VKGGRDRLPKLPADLHRTKQDRWWPDPNLGLERVKLRHNNRDWCMLPAECLLDVCPICMAVIETKRHVFCIVLGYKANLLPVPQQNLHGVAAERVSLVALKDDIGVVSSVAVNHSFAILVVRACQSFSLAQSRIRSCSSGEIRGRPGPPLELDRQWRRKALRCQRTTVCGLMMMRA
jgi:hypothetical protein